MQKLILFTLIVFSAFAISCDEKKPLQTDDINISVTLPPFADFVKQITGNRANINTLIPPGTNAHSFEPTPVDIKNLLNSHIYFRVGKIFNLENTIFGKVHLDTTVTKTIDCSNGIEILNNDPHFWLSPTDVKIITNTMLNALIKLYPQHKNYFTNNRNKFIHNLDSIDNINSKIISEKKERSFFVYHPAWTYLATHYNLEQFSVEQDGKAPKANAIKDFINLVKSKNGSVIFFDPHFDNASVNTIANSLNIKIDSLDPLPVNYLENLDTMGKKFNEYLK